MCGWVLRAFLAWSGKGLISSLELIVKKSKREPQSKTETTKEFIAELFLIYII